MIYARITRNPSTEQIDGIHISITEDSLPNFQQLIHRALNTWDSAPKELKELGDMLVHGYVTQDHTYTPINTKQNTDYYSESDKALIQVYITEHGQQAWIDHLNAGTTHKVLKGED